MNAREGDYIEDANGLIFDVKGLVHPYDRVIAFPRFIPDSAGERERDNKFYRKIYALSERFALLEEKLPEYLVYDKIFNARLCEVPVVYVRNHYQPASCLQVLQQKTCLDELESQGLSFLSLLRKHANVTWSRLGVSGSIMVDLHTTTSDIDPVVYGSNACRKVHSALRNLLSNNEDHVTSFSLKELKELFDFRSKDTFMSFEDFVRTDSRKVLQGKFMGRDYFIRFVKEWNEIEEHYGSIIYKPKGYTKIKAKIIDDSDALFTPCCYRVGNVKILEGPSFDPIAEIVSFRGRFCEQARNGETVVAQGKVEMVQKEGEREHFRLLLGNKISDYMILA